MWKVLDVYIIPLVNVRRCVDNTSYYLWLSSMCKITVNFTPLMTGESYFSLCKRGKVVRHLPSSINISFCYPFPLYYIKFQTSLIWVLEYTWEFYRRIPRLSSFWNGHYHIRYWSRYVKIKSFELLYDQMFSLIKFQRKKGSQSLTQGKREVKRLRLYKKSWANFIRRSYCKKWRRGFNPI